MCHGPCALCCRPQGSPQQARSGASRRSLRARRSSGSSSTCFSVSAPPCDDAVCVRECVAALTAAATLLTIVYFGAPLAVERARVAVAVSEGRAADAGLAAALVFPVALAGSGKPAWQRRASLLLSDVVLTHCCAAFLGALAFPFGTVAQPALAMHDFPRVGRPPAPARPHSSSHSLTPCANAGCCRICVRWAPRGESSNALCYDPAIWCRISVLRVSESAGLICLVFACQCFVSGIVLWAIHREREREREKERERVLF
jgi:hypothetical protein